MVKKERTQYLIAPQTEKNENAEVKGNKAKRSQDEWGCRNRLGPSYHTLTLRKAK